MSRIKGKQLAKHLKLSGSLSISGSADSPHTDAAALDIQGGVNVETNQTASKGIIDGGFFGVGSSKVIIP